VLHERVDVELRSWLTLEVIRILPIGDSNLHARSALVTTFEALGVAHG